MGLLRTSTGGAINANRETSRRVGAAPNVLTAGPQWTMNWERKDGSLITGFGIGLFALFFVPFPFPILPLIGFEIWQISDLIVIIKRTNNKQTI